MFSESNEFLLHHWLVNLYGGQLCKVQVFYGTSFEGMFHNFGEEMMNEIDIRLIRAEIGS